MARLFHNRIGPYLPLAEKYNCIILPGIISHPSYQSLLESEKAIVLWLHNNPDEFLPPVNLDFFQNPKLHEKLRLVITVSNYAKSRLVEQSGMAENKIETINNAIGDIPFDRRKFTREQTPRLIYISHPQRGLHVLLKALNQRKEEFVLDVYGDASDDFFHSLPRPVREDQRFSFHGRRPRHEVLKALSTAHIFVYPAIWYETFCVSLAEALSAGCIAVYNSIGSLSEVGLGHGITYLHENFNDLNGHIYKLNASLDEAFDLLGSRKFVPDFQVLEVSTRYSHENFTISWFKLAAKLLGNAEI